MYSRRIVEERLAVAASEVGFVPEYHSASEVDAFTEKLERRYAPVYEAAQAAAQGSKEPSQIFQTTLYKALCNPGEPKLSADEVRFMQNERALCACDAEYFVSRYYYIQDDENNIRRFSFRPAQRILFDVMAELEDQGVAIELMIPKARQLGVTTEAVGFGLQKIAFSFSVSGVIASAEQDKTEDMVDKVFLAYDLMPWWLRPVYTKRVNSAKGLLVFGGAKVRLRFQHGNQMSGIARGGTPIFYHLSECVSFSDPEALIDAALFKCVHPSPRVLGFLESTCEGKTGWWPDTYWYSKANWPRVRLKTVFLPFYLAPDQYPNPTWLRKNPLPESYRPDQDTRQMIAESKLYIQSDPVLRKVLGEHWEMPQEVAWFWQCNFNEAKAKRAEKSWYEEMPNSDIRAFQGNYDNVFGKSIIAEAWSRRDTKYEVFAVIGQSIEDRHEPDPEEIDYRYPRIPIKWTSKRDETFRWELVPLFWQEPFVGIDDKILRDGEEHMGKLFIWHQPEPGYDYSIGIDTSNGIGRDSTVIAVARRGRAVDEPDIQAAEFRSNKVSHVEAFAWAAAIGAHYARHMGGTIRYTQPYFAIEQIAAVGDTCQLQLSKMGMSRFHMMVRYDSKPKDLKKSKSHKMGWYTNSWSRSMLTDGFVTLTINGWYVLNSPWTIYECDNWEVHVTGETGKTKYIHSEDMVDDGIFANAMAGFCPNDLRSMTERTKKKFVDPAGGGPALPVLDINPISTGRIVVP
jgi:hypothetical protein